MSIRFAKPVPCAGCGVLVQNPRDEWDFCVQCDEELTLGQAEADLHTAVSILGIGAVLRVLREICEESAGFAGTLRDRTYEALAVEMRQALHIAEGV